MKILFAQPSERLFIGKKKKHGSIMPPLGLLSLASEVEVKLPEIEIDIVDFEAKNGEPDPNYSDYDIVAITGTTVHMPHAFQISKEIRKKNEEACILIGGPHATFCHDQMLNSLPELDAVCRGEGEISLIEFIKKFKDRKDLPIVKGFSTRSQLSKDFSPIVKDLSSLSPVAYEKINIEKYQLSTHRNLPLPFASIMTTRGCPFKCNYCQTPNMFGDKLRFRSPKLIADEIENLIDNHGLKSIVFWDDTFTANKKHTIELCRAIKGFDINWMCNTRVECVSPELLAEMKEAGCKIIFYGVESSHETTLKDFNRKMSLEDIKKAFNWTHEAGIETVGTLMIGAPNDTLMRIEQNIDFLKTITKKVYISIYNVTPGANDFEKAQKEGVIPKEIDWHIVGEYKDPPFGLPTVNQKLNRYELQEAQKYAYNSFYGRDDENV